jgi:single-strand DNA-binding protein
MNRIILLGRLTDDPDVKVTTEGTPFGRFVLAVDRPDRAGAAREIDSIPVVAWREHADALRSFKKEDVVLVEGRISVRSFDKDGTRKWVTEVDARSIRRLNAGQLEAAAPVMTSASRISTKDTGPASDDNFDFSDGLRFPGDSDAAVLEAADDIPF